MNAQPTRSRLSNYQEVVIQLVTALFWVPLWIAYLDVWLPALANHPYWDQTVFSSCLMAMLFVGWGVRRMMQRCFAPIEKSPPAADEQKS